MYLYPKSGTLTYVPNSQPPTSWQVMVGSSTTAARSRGGPHLSLPFFAEAPHLILGASNRNDWTANIRRSGCG